MCGGRGVLRSYGELFAIPGTAAFSATGLLARLPISQFSIAVILLISATTGSYGLAGQVAGAAALAGALVMPVIARAVDARGQARVTRPVILVGTAAWCAFAVAVLRDWPVASWFALADLNNAIGVKSDFYLPSAVFAALAKSEPAFAGLSYETLGLYGAPLAGAQAGAA